jgi:hypothetical protein
MNAERQPGRLYQRMLFEQSAESLPHDAGGDGGTRPAASEEPQAFTAFDQARALTQHLMEEVVNRENLNRAYHAWFQAHGLIELLPRYLELQQ